MTKLTINLLAIMGIICLLHNSTYSQCDEKRRPDINLDFDDDQRELLRDKIIEYLTSVTVPDQEGTIEYYFNVGAHSGQNQAHGASSQWHSGMAFLTWHRAYVQGLENFLLSEGLTMYVPLPGWDPSTQIPDAFFNNGSVVSHQNDSGNELFPDLNNQSISSPGSNVFYNDNTCDDFETLLSYANGINGPHGSVHVNIGGTMSTVRRFSAIKSSKFMDKPRYMGKE